MRSRVLEPATRGTVNVLQSCVRAGTVRRVVFTSSISTMTAAGAEGRQRKAVVDESCVTALDDVWRAKPVGWVSAHTSLRSIDLYIDDTSKCGSSNLCPFFRADLHPVQAADGGGGVRIRAGEGRPPGLHRYTDGCRAVPDANCSYERPALAVAHNR